MANSGERLRETVRRWDASGGTDGWRRVEWKQFTPDMLEHLAEFQMCNEEEAVALSWGEDALFAPVATIPKDDNSRPGPLDLRPITVTSRLYASRASTRSRDPRDWIARGVDDSVVGGREGKQVQEAVWPLILELESAAASDSPLSAAAFDASKFFNHMEWDTTFSIFREFGMFARVLKPMANHVFRLQRFSSKVRAVVLCGEPVMGSSKAAHLLWWPQWQLPLCGQSLFEPRAQRRSWPQ